MLKTKHIDKGGRLISDIIEIARLKMFESFVVTMGIEKAFDSLDHNFLISTLEKYGFGKNFTLWVKILMIDQKSCAINGGTTTNYFWVVRGACQGDPISVFLFVLALEVFFILIKPKPEIEGATSFD